MDVVDGMKGKEWERQLLPTALRIFLGWFFF